MDELKALRNVIQEQRPVDRPVGGKQNSSQLNMELIPSEFVLRLFRVLRGLYRAPNELPRETQR